MTWDRLILLLGHFWLYFSHQELNHVIMTLKCRVNITDILGEIFLYSLVVHQKL